MSIASPPRVRVFTAKNLLALLVLCVAATGLLRFSGPASAWTAEQGHAFHLKVFYLLLAAMLLVATVFRQFYRRLQQETQERARTEAELRQRSEILALVLNSIGDAVVVADSDQNILLFNPAAERIFRGKFAHLSDLWPESAGIYVADQVTALPPDQAPLARALRNDPVDKLDLFMSNAGAGGIWARVSGRPLQSSSWRSETVHRAVMVLSDISDLKRAEGALFATNKELELRNREVERANHLKSQFLASMSHELRTPLNAIIGFSDLMTHARNGHLNEKQTRFLERIRTASRHLLDLINDILDLSKIEAGSLQLHRENFPIGEAASEVLSIVKPLAMAKTITLVDNLNRNLWVNADRIRFKQVLYNLLSNAIKFTPEGGAVCMDSRAEEASVCISVTDTGIGIRPEDQEVIFESFRQVGGTTRGIAEGTGLGLAIVKRIVQQHGGIARVESALGKGSRFSFTVAERCATYAAAIDMLSPVPSMAERARPILASVPLPFHLAVPAHTPVRKPLVLIADDELASREWILACLEEEGYETITASTGAEAAERTRALTPALVILDVLLSDESGWATLKNLKQDPATSRVPIVVMTAIDDRPAGLALGADAYLLKPAAREEFLRTVQQHAGRQRRLASSAPASATPHTAEAAVPGR